MTYYIIYLLDLVDTMGYFLVYYLVLGIIYLAIEQVRTFKITADATHLATLFLIYWYKKAKLLASQYLGAYWDPAE